MGYLRCCAGCSRSFTADNRRGSFYCITCAGRVEAIFAPKVGDMYRLVGDRSPYRYVLLEAIAPDTFRVRPLGFPEMPCRDVHVSQFDPFNRTRPNDFA